MRRPSALIALAIVAWLWVLAIVIAPRTPPAIATATYLAGSLICHQMPGRSFHLDNAQLPVCARCAGLYAGGALGITLWTVAAGVRRRASALAQRLTTSTHVRVMLAIVAAPTIVTVATGMSGLWDPGNLLRAAFAIPLGGGIGAVVAAAAAGDLR